MSDVDKSNAGAKPGGGWTDKERLVYLYALVEQTGIKPDYKNTPRPNNRTELACERMIGRLKNTLKDELDALKAGTYGGDEVVTPRKRKTPAKDKSKDDQVNGDADGSPKKRGRKKKVDIEAAKKDAADADAKMMSEDI
ncbi:unnamed protein product [Periconia digitata]|uniref:Uncharacterized protein n=1 Tax=Periconia digitata TaxID=1303443 RepID=A0A9W4XW11_9PLEO|nr:unnamed protein product [Periconia digitata]